jgi:uncharacterized membrane protein
MTLAADTTYRIILALLALTGLGDSFIFAFNALRKRETEIVCRDGTCVRLSPYAAVFFHIPNWIFGIIYYVLTLIAVITTDQNLILLSLVGVIVTSIFSTYLIHSLVVKLKVMCKLCYVAHAVNYALLLIWLLLFASNR